ncbi:DUF6794 domain-containing protein [Undibacterium sp.]|jgi:hypothetical protein|uniref:DUF6794 domain-containing protein n=1 Tax=Undibacterium sp. TaxID=1914977 RepID=UPI0039C942A2
MYILKSITGMISTFLAPITSASPKTRLQVLPRDQWPDNVGDTVSNLLARMSPSDKAMLRATRRQDLFLYNRSLGLNICSYYGLNRGNRKLFLAACGRRRKPEDVSEIIIEELWLRLQYISS